MTQDQVFVPRTRTQFGLPPLNPDGETLLGSSIRTEVMKEMQEAIGDSPIGALFGAASYLVSRSLLAGGPAFKQSPVLARWLAHVSDPQRRRPETLSSRHQSYVYTVSW